MTTRRPTLNKNISIQVFKKYYWLKIELMQFCRKNDLSTHGSKLDLVSRIEVFLATGKNDIPNIRRIKKHEWDSERSKISKDTPVKNYKSDPITRAFFQKEIGPHFKFKAVVLTWIKAKLLNQEHFTYADIIAEWIRIDQLKRDPNYKRVIPKQFQFNQFLADWKAAKAGPGALDAWKFIRSLPEEPTYAKYIKVLNRGGKKLKNPTIDCSKYTKKSLK